MLRHIGSSEMTDWAAIFSIEDEEAAKLNEKMKNNQQGDEDDDEDITDALIAAIEADKTKESVV